MNPVMEDHFNAAPHKDSNLEVIKSEVIEEATSEISISNKESQLKISDDLSIVNREEVRENYEHSQSALVRSLSVGEKLLKKISDDLDYSVIEIGNQNRLYESAGMLMKALNDTAKTLVKLHIDAGNIFGDVNKIEIDNSKNTVAVGPDTLQQLADLAKQHNGIITNGSYD